MNRIIEQTREYLARHELKAQALDNCLVCDISGDHGQCRTVVDTDDAGFLLTVVTSLAVRVPAEQRAAQALELARLNHGRRLGGWHLDLADGQLLFCVSVPTAGLQEHFDSIMAPVFGLAFSEADEQMARLAKNAFQSRISSGESPGASGQEASEVRIQLN